MDSGLSLLANTIEIASAGLFSMAGFIIFRYKGNTLAEAGAYGLTAMLMLHSWLAQVLLLTGWQRLFTPLQLILMVAATVGVVMHRGILAGQLAGVGRFARIHWPVVCSLLLAWAWLAALWCQGVPPPAPAVGTVPDVWLNSGLGQAAFGGPATAVPVLNHAVWLTFRQPAAATGAANLSAYLVIALATYALARRYAWPPTAVTVALLVVSMPRLAHQSLAACSELLPAAAALMVILALYRAVEEPHPHDLVMLVCAITFSVAGGRLCYVLPAVLAGLSLLVMARRHDIRLWPQAIRRHLAALGVTVALALVFSQIVTVAINIETGASWIGWPAPDRVGVNPDGLSGAAANMARYFLQSIHFPEMIDRFAQRVLGVSGPAGLETIYRSVVEPLVDGKGAAAVFDVTWTSACGGGWFGPVGFLLVLPSLLNAIRRGPHRLKTTALALAGYWVLIALLAAWQPSNVRLMTPLFAGAGFMMAFFLPPWRLGRKGRLVLQLIGVALLAGDLLP